MSLSRRLSPPPTSPPSLQFVDVQAAENAAPTVRFVCFKLCKTAIYSSVHSEPSQRKPSFSQVLSQPQQQQQHSPRLRREHSQIARGLPS
mmetsp:Transcript_35379/g.75429  ORF Transcript_35379/g.75429 Transcript_35379/m.75429 type:complete len:90 (-) Transcript_35379:145-414(-)